MFYPGSQHLCIPQLLQLKQTLFLRASLTTPVVLAFSPNTEELCFSSTAF